jgi:hypothetical protein
MAESGWDQDGAVQSALALIVSTFGLETLSDEDGLKSRLSDVLPADANLRERDLLIAAARFHIADAIQDRIVGQGMSSQVAIGLGIADLENHGYSASGSAWVVQELVHVLGHPVDPPTGEMRHEEETLDVVEPDAEGTIISPDDDDDDPVPGAVVVGTSGASAFSAWATKRGARGIAAALVALLVVGYLAVAGATSAFPFAKAPNRQKVVVSTTTTTQVPHNSTTTSSSTTSTTSPTPPVTTTVTVTPTTSKPVVTTPVTHISTPTPTPTPTPAPTPTPTPNSPPVPNPADQNHAIDLTGPTGSGPYLYLQPGSFSDPNNDPWVIDFATITSGQVYGTIVRTATGTNCTSSCYTYQPNPGVSGNISFIIAWYAIDPSGSDKDSAMTLDSRYEE